MHFEFKLLKTTSLYHKVIFEKNCYFFLYVIWTLYDRNFKTYSKDYKFNSLSKISNLLNLSFIVELNT